jgi:hypothetical protein
VICNKFCRIKLLHVGATSYKTKEWQYSQKKFSLQWSLSYFDVVFVEKQFFASF